MKSVCNNADDHKEKPMNDQTQQEAPPFEPDVQQEGQEVTPPAKPKRVRKPKPEGSWTPARVWSPLRGPLAGAKLMRVPGATHNRKGKVGQFMDIIASSGTVEEALCKAATVRKGNEDVQEFMDPGYVRVAEKLGLVIVQRAAPQAPQEKPQAPQEQEMPKTV